MSSSRTSAASCSAGSRRGLVAAAQLVLSLAVGVRGVGAGDEGGAAHCTSGCAHELTNKGAVRLSPPCRPARFIMKHTLTRTRIAPTAPACAAALCACVRRVSRVRASGATGAAGQHPAPSTDTRTHDDTCRVTHTCTRAHTPAQAHHTQRRHGARTCTCRTRFVGCETPHSAACFRHPVSSPLRPHLSRSHPGPSMRGHRAASISGPAASTHPCIHSETLSTLHFRSSHGMWQQIDCSFVHGRADAVRTLCTAAPWAAMAAPS